jgi:streptomycin 3"-adenylyltransferase
MRISGKMGNAEAVRPLEVTVINRADVVPWRYPPKKEFIYGEWLRGQYEQGPIPEPEVDPDLAILLYQVRGGSLPLLGGEASEILDPVPMPDVFKAMRDCLPGLMKWLRGDERNVLLTLARMWVTAADGRIVPKDEAAEWAAPRLSKEQARLLGLAGKAYRGEYADRWEGLEDKTVELARQMIKEIEACLDSGR